MVDGSKPPRRQTPPNKNGETDKVRTRLVWSSKTTPRRAAVGRLVRWREVPRGRWQYGYYLGRKKGVAMIGLSPEGPPIIWTHGYYPEVQGAYVEVIPDEQCSGGAST